MSDFQTDAERLAWFKGYKVASEELELRKWCVETALKYTECGWTPQELFEWVVPDTTESAA